MSLGLISKVTNHFKLKGALLFHASSHVFAILCPDEAWHFHFVHDHTFMSLLLKRGMQFESTTGLYLHVRVSERLISIKKYFLVWSFISVLLTVAITPLIYVI